MSQGVRLPWLLQAPASTVPQATTHGLRGARAVLVGNQTEHGEAVTMQSQPLVFASKTGWALGLSSELLSNLERRSRLKRDIQGAITAK